MHLKPAAALLALAYADHRIQFTASAEKVRNHNRDEESNANGDGTGAGNANEEEQEQHDEYLATLVLGAEFHRSVVRGGLGGRKKRRLLAPSDTDGDTAGATLRGGERPRIQRILANLRRKRFLAVSGRGTSKRSAVGGEGRGRDIFKAPVDKQDDEDTSNALPPADAAAVTTKGLKECVPKVHEDDTASIDEDEDTDPLAGTDVGVLSYRLPEEDEAKCEEGYTCLAFEESTAGGLCLPDAGTALPTGTALTAAADQDQASELQDHRTLQDGTLEDGTLQDGTLEDGTPQAAICPAGCPAKVCECYAMYNDEDPTCLTAMIDSCRDGSYVEFCGTDDPLEKAYAQVYCDAYICLDDKGLSDAIADETVCDITDESCAECYCELYSAMCDTFTPICAADPTSSYTCYDLDYVCDVKDCCAKYGAECIMDITTYPPVETPPPNPTPGATSGAASGAWGMVGGGGSNKYALLGASAALGAVLAGGAGALF